jgi:hypothetical protein
MCTEPPPIQKKKFLGLSKGPFITLMIFAIVILVVLNGPDNSSIMQIPPLIDKPNLPRSLSYSGDCTDLVATKDGGLAFICQTHTIIRTEWSSTDYLLVKTNSSGMVEWSKSLIEAGPDFHFYNIIQDHDTGFVLAGDYKNVDIFLLKTDKDGKILWNNTYRMTGSTVTDLILLQDGGFAMVGGSGMIITDVKGTVLWNRTFSSYAEINALVQTDGGFTFIGTENSAESNLLLMNTDEEGNILWSKRYDEFEGLISNKIVKTQDQGFTFVGGELEGPHISLIKTDSTGEIVWSQEFESILEYDGFHPLGQELDLIETSNRNLIVAGYQRPDYFYTYDIIETTHIYKTTINGKIIWDYSHKGGFNSLIETSDGNYVLAGFIDTNEDSFQEDPCLMKIDPEGTVVWKRAYSGFVNEEWAKCVVQTLDGGLAFTGSTSSYGAGKTDMWLVKTDTNGQVEWNKTYGGDEEDEEAHYLFQTTNGDFFIIGRTTSFDSVNGMKIFIVKADVTGTLLWNRTYEQEIGWNGSCMSGVYFLLYSFQTNDGGIICVGTGESHSGLWLAKIDGYGEVQWDKEYINLGLGDTGFQFFRTSDSGFIYKMTEDNTTIIKLNSAGNVVWNQSFTSHLGYNYRPTPDNGCIGMGIADYSTWHEEQGPCVQLMKLDVDGNIEWTQSFDEANFSSCVVSYASSWQQTPDNGYVCALSDWSYTHLVKVDCYGEIKWIKEYKGYERIAKVCITQENEFLILLQRGNQKILEKVNIEGITQWTQAFLMGDLCISGGAGTTNFFMFQMNDTILLSGPTLTGSLFLSRFSLESGDILLNQTLPSIYYSGSGYYSNRFYRVFPYYFFTNASNSVLVAITDGTWSVHIKWILNIHQNGTLLWNHTFYPFQISSIISTKDGSFVLVGTVWNFPGQHGVSQDAYVLKLNENLTIEWVHTYGSSCARISHGYLIEETVFKNTTSTPVSFFPFLPVLLVLVIISIGRRK